VKRVPPPQLQPCPYNLPRQLVNVLAVLVLADADGDNVNDDMGGFNLINNAIPLSGHIFMALINRDTREGVGSIIDGEVDAEWAKRHHPLWMERMAKDRVLEKMAGKDAGSADKRTENA